MLARLIIATLALLCVAQCAWITKDLEVARVRPAVAQVANKIYIAGGQIADGIETKSIEVLNADTFEFEDINLNLPSARQQFSAVAIGSKIFYSGGLETLSNLVIFNQTSAVFSLLQKAPWVRNVQHIQFLNTSSLCVFGDNSLDIYNALTNTWTSVEEYRNVVKQLFKFGFGVVNNVAYIVGGVFPNNGTLSPNVWTFDLLSHKLTCHNNTIFPQYFPHGLKLSFSASAIIMNGGFNGTNYNQIVNILNLNTTKWFSTNCDDLTPALNAISLGAVTDTHAYIAIDAKNAGLNAKIKIVDLANFGVSLTALPLMNGAWTSLVTVGSKVFACGQGVALNTYYIIDGTSFDVGLTLTGALPEMSFELNGKFVLLSPLGDLYTFDPLAIVQSLLSILSTPASAIIDAKVAGQSLAVVYENNKAAIITSAGTLDVSKTLDGDILGIFGDCIVTTTTSYVTSTLDEIKAVTGTIPSSADIVGLFDSLPGTCAVMNILEDVVSRITQKIDVYDTIANSWSTLNIPALADKTLTFAGSLDDCLVLTAGNVAYLVNTTASTIKNQFTLDNVNNAVDAIRAYVQAPEINGTIYVGVGGNLAEVTLTSSDLTVRSDAPHVINHLCHLDDVIYVADVESTKMYLYNLVNNTWSSVSLAGNKLVNYALAAVNDTILIVGGNDGALSAIGGVANDLQTVMVFNPISASLSVLDLDINARSEVTPFSTPDSAVFIGGQNSYGQHQSTVDIYSARASATTEPNVNTNPNTNPNNNPNNTPVASSSVVVLANVVLLLIASLVSF